MVGKRLAISILAAAAALIATAAQAADYPQPPPPPPPIIIQQPIQEFDSWYLRGDIGITNQQVDRLSNVLDANNSIQNVGIGFDASPLFGIGIGYNFNKWLRLDLTGEYRSKANFHGLQIFNSNFTDEYRASKSEWLFMANGYVDLGTWSGFTPFVGAGVGVARNTIHSFLDVNTPNLGVAFGETESKWNFAWALHAGIAYNVTRNVIIELAYRYVDLGDAMSGDLTTYLGQNNVYNPETFHNLTSHDVKIGLRFNFGSEAYYAPPPPQYYVPPPAYTPPPVYMPPAPLQSHG